MKTINLRQLYPHIHSDFILEVSDEIALALQDFDRCEHAYQMRRSRNKAYYSLDRDAGVEKEILLVAAGPDSIYESKLTRLELNAAISKLPHKQAMRIYAHFILGISKYAIARAEGVSESCVRESISRGLANLARCLKNC